MFAKTAKTPMSLGWKMQTHDYLGRTRAMYAKGSQNSYELELAKANK